MTRMGFATRFLMRHGAVMTVVGWITLTGGVAFAGQDPFAPTADVGLGTRQTQPTTLTTSATGNLPPRTSEAPDVQVLVLGGIGHEDQINLTYPVLVPRSQVQRDIDALTRETAWPQHDLSVTDSALPMSGYKTPTMTSVTFSSPGAITANEGHFHLEPIIVALRAYPKIAVTFVVAQPFGFNGLRDYSDTHVKIALKRMGSAYAYTINVQDPKFTRLNLPLWQADPATVRSATVPARPRRSWGTLRVIGLVVITICAAAAGYGVYAWLARLQ